MKTDCCCPPAKAGACGCCEGIEAITPVGTANRPGLAALSYRIGTHATFLETMKARLTTHFLEKEIDGQKEKAKFNPLLKLTSREVDDFSIALLDAWAIVADVLTFYQERIANEGYLRTATERRSILELARLVGYQPRPGVASSVYLAYTLDTNFKEETTIPKGARSQSLPGPGELPQSFETSEDLKARAKWNNLKPRMTQPQTKESIEAGDRRNQHIYLKGIATNVKTNDPLLIDFLGNDQPKFFRIKKVLLDATTDRTLVTLQEDANKALPPPVRLTPGLIDALTLPPSAQLANSLRLKRDLTSIFGGSVSGAGGDSSEDFLRKALAGGEASHAALKAFAPGLRETLATATANAEVIRKSQLRVYALRNKAATFGHNMSLTAPPVTPSKDDIVKDQKRNLGKTDALTPNTLALEAEYKEIKQGDWIAVERRAPSTITVMATRVLDVTTQTLGDFPPPPTLNFFTTYPPWTMTLDGNNPQISVGQPIRTKSTVLTLGDPWHKEDEKPEDVLRSTNVYFQSEELELAEEPIDETVCGGTHEMLELDGLYEGLESGRWVIVSGERDLAGTSGVRFSELAMLASVTQNVQSRQRILNGEPVSIPLFGDRTHTFITLATELKYCFKRDTVTIYGNVVKATHGETRKEVLGSGDGAKALQSFLLKQPPLTYVPASNPTGVDSTLKVYVNDVQWKETDALAGLFPTDRKFITKTDDDSKTTVVFGNGREGARLPTGIENIKAEYRNGIGKSGNVKAEQITLLSTRPLGVKDVINPLRASGGAEKESRDQARKNAPLGVKALDRLVSVQDYEDFTRIYAGIGKAKAVELSDGRRQVVHITIAGADDIPIDVNSDLYRNLRQSLLDSGDPHQPIQLEIRELMLIVISARIRILSEYQWEPVVTQVRTTLLDAFGFERRELGQDVLLSEVVSVMQNVRGVEYVDVDAFGGIPEKEADIQGRRHLLTPSRISEEVQKIVEQGAVHRILVNLADLQNKSLQPAQLAFLTPDVPETLILNQIT